MKKTLLLLAGFLLAVSAIAARSKKTPAGDFDYYVLSLSWAPDFCAQSGSKGTAAECGAGRHVGFVVHGLWPQDNAARGPENCGNASPVARSIVTLMLKYIPTASLIQHEWATHGTCSALSASDYFAAMRQARDSVEIPSQLSSLNAQTTLSPAQIEKDFAAANVKFPAAAFHSTCSAGMLQEVRVCFTKGISPQACTANAGECASAAMIILPPR
jgi:ribonuclease T2